MDYKTMKLDDIINWCKANNQVAWLKAEAAKTCVNKKGETHPINFIQLKKAFVDKFMPEIAPKATKKAPTMFDKIAAL